MKKTDTLFKPGHPKMGGRTRGSRDKLSRAFIEALLKKFEECGEEALRIVYAEDTLAFLKLIASVVPKELEINDARQLSELTDDELAAVVTLARAKMGRNLGGGGDGEDETESRH